MNTATASQMVSQKRIVVCVGTGGVGKTTIAAAVALEGARQGRRALVLTIDPARRLADALGVESLGNQPREVAQDRRDALGIPEQGRLSAMMLDMKRTFDDMVDPLRRQPRDAIDRILANRIYQHVSDALAGSAEYAAMEKVFEMLSVRRVRPDRRRHAPLTARPRLPRSTRVGCSNSSTAGSSSCCSIPPSRRGASAVRLFQRTTQRVLQLFERVSGISFLEDISEFLLAFEGMSEGFRQRAGEVRQLLLGPESAFVLVAAPSREAARGARAFLDDLERSNVPLMGVVANRVRLWPESADGCAPELSQALLEHGRDAIEQELSQLGHAERSEALARAAVQVAKGYASLVRLDRQHTEPLRLHADSRGAFFRRIGELPRDVHDLDGLRTVGAQLFVEQETNP